MQTKVKFCGFTNLNDVLEALKLGVDYIGFAIEMPTNVRSISIHNLKNIVQEARQAFPKNFPKVVAVTSNLDSFKLRQLVDCGVVDIIQFHGNEDRYILSQFYSQIEVWKAFEIIPGTQDLIQKLANLKNFVHKFVFDKPKFSGSQFGSSQEFIQANRLGFDLVLAGGLDNQNVSQYISQLQPAIVDVSSGIEDKIGQKSTQKMKSFLEAVYSYKFTYKSPFK